MTTAVPIPADGWPCELTVDERADADLPSLNRTSTERPWRASEKGLLPIRLVDYLELLDSTGRMLREGKRGAIPAHCAPILERLGIRQSLWTDLVTRFDRLFGAIVGPASRVAERAAAAGRRWYRGQANCAAAFG